MKKIIIMLAMAASAAVVHAAACSWSMTNVYEPGTTTQSNGYIAYLFIESESVTLAGITESIEGGNSIATLATANTTTSSGKVSLSGIDAGLVASSSYTAFSVIFDASSQEDASNYMITKEVTKTVAATGASVAFGFGTQAATTWAAVPEPTTGLLLLLGMAGLALKRKVA